MDKDEFKRLREDEFKVTQAEFANILDLSHTTITRYETGRQTIPSKVERKINALLKERENSGNSIQQGDYSSAKNVIQSVGEGKVHYYAGTSEQERIEYLEQLILEKDKRIALLEKLLEKCD